MDVGFGKLNFAVPSIKYTPGANHIEHKFVGSMVPPDGTLTSPDTIGLIVPRFSKPVFNLLLTKLIRQNYICQNVTKQNATKSSGSILLFLYYNFYKKY